VLIYPTTDAFMEPLPVFNFTKADGMRLWVLPFCIDEDRLKFPMFPQLQSIFVDRENNSKQPSEFDLAQVKLND